VNKILKTPAVWERLSRESVRREAERLGEKERFGIADDLWNLRETKDNGLYTTPYWEDCIVMGDYLYSLGYRRVEEQK